MNHRKYLNSAALKTNPLCGIDTYKDILDLASGQTTRKIKKYVFTGNETFYISSQTSVFYTTQIVTDCNKSVTYNTGCIVNAYKIRKQTTAANLLDGEFTTDSNGYLWFRNYDYATLTDFIAYLAQQYAAGTPVTIWYVLETSETEQITVPSGLSGTLEGLLTQSGTPTPSDPICPTAVTGEGWYNINTYKRSVLVWNTDTTYERDSGAWT